MSFRDFYSLVYSGELSRDLDVNSVEIKDSSASCHQEIKVHDRVGKFLVQKLNTPLTQSEGGQVDMVVDKLWKLKVPSKVQSFIWLVYLDRIPSKYFFLKRGVSIPDNLVGCP
ncbi:hypothetical protein GQ457_01G016580 [Hibiscus cannabinus]